MTPATCQGCRLTFDRGLVATPTAIGDTSELISGIGFLSEKETKATAAATNL